MKTKNKILIILIIGIIIICVGILTIFIKPNNNKKINEQPKKIIDKDYELNMKLHELYKNTEIEETITGTDNDNSIIKFKIKNKSQDNISINKVRITIYNQEEEQLQVIDKTLSKLLTPKEYTTFKETINISSQQIDKVGLEFLE